MLEQTVSEFYPILTEKNLAWNADIPPGIWILCDRDKLARVFDNLICNAVNYNYEDSEISLSMSTYNDNVEIILKNRGKTIPPQKLFQASSKDESIVFVVRLPLADGEEISQKN